MGRICALGIVNLKNHLMRYQVLLYLVFFFSIIHAQTQRISLQIGISQYPQYTGWSSIHGLNDLDMLGPIMQREGFEVRQVREDQAKLLGIRMAMDQLQADVSTGSMVHLHFSLHGQQLPDDNADEFDQFDEALIPFDAIANRQNGYAGEQHLRDDELYSRLSNLRKKIGPTGQVWVTLDACHSGTATRGWGTFRGSIVPFGRNKTSRNAMTEPAWEVGTQGDEDANLAPLVLFSATTAQQLNREYFAPNGKMYGALSYALAQSLSGAVQATTFGTLFNRVCQSLALNAPMQTPQFEGDEQLVRWSAIRSKHKPLFPVLKVWDAQTLLIGAGYLHGLHADAPISIYNADETQLLAKGRATNIGIQESEVVLEKALAPQLLMQASARVEYAKNSPTAIRIKLLTDEPLKKALRDRIQNEPELVEVIENPDILIENSNARQWVVSTVDGREVLRSDMRNPLADADLIYLQALLPVIKAHYFRHLTSSDLGEAVQLVFHTYQNGALQPRKNTNAFKIGEEFRLELINTGKQNYYFNLLDIQANDQISSINPTNHPESKPGDWLIKANERKMLEPTWRFTPPEGLEMLKLIVSNKPIDLTTVLTSNRSFTRSMDAFFEQKRSLEQTGNTLMEQTSVSVYTIVFRIEK
jgi:metacaspase-1